MNVVQFWPDPARVFAELKRLLKPGGTIATTFMPRIGADKHASAAAKANELTIRLHEIGFASLETHWLAQRPAPAFCLLARS